MLKRTVSLRRFFWVPTIYVLVERYEFFFFLGGGGDPLLTKGLISIIFHMYLIQNFACWEILNAFLSSVYFFLQNSTFSKYSFMDTIRNQNSLDQDQAWCFVEPRHVGLGLVPHCFQLSADNKSCQEQVKSQRIKIFVWFDSLRHINNLSVKQELVFLGWTSTKLG